MAVEPKSKADQDKLGIALQRLAEEDPTFKVFTDEETGQTIIAGMGELHLEIIVDRLLREFKVEAISVSPRLLTVRPLPRLSNPKEVHTSKRWGGQYGHVVLEVEPNEPGRIPV